MKLLERLQQLLESRGGARSPWGKMDNWQEGFRVETTVKEAFRQRCASLHRGESEMLRECMRLVAFGPEEVKRMQDAGVDQVAGLLGGMLGEKSGAASK